VDASVVAVGAEYGVDVYIHGAVAEGFLVGIASEAFKMGVTRMA
jgi:hypothetical protein